MGPVRRRIQNLLDREPHRLGKRVGDSRSGRIGVGVCGEQRRTGTDQAMDECSLGIVGGHRVHTAQQQRMVGQQQAARADGVDNLGGGVHRDGHRLDEVAGIAAHQTDRIPVAGQARRIGLIEHVDDVGQSHAHRSTSATASTSTGHSGLTAARR